MNRRILSTLAVSGGLLAAAAFVPTAQAGNVAWSVSVGGPGFAVSAGQPGYYGRGYYGAPYLRPIAHPYYRPWYGASVVVPPVAYVRPRVIYPYAPAPVVYAPRPIVYTQPYSYGYPYYAPGSGSY